MGLGGCSPSPPPQNFSNSHFRGEKSGINSYLLQVSNVTLIWKSEITFASILEIITFCFFLFSRFFSVVSCWYVGAVDKLVRCNYSYLLSCYQTIYPVMANSGEVRTFKSAHLAWGFQEGHLLRSTMQLKICFALFLIFFFPPHYVMNVCPYHHARM